MTASRAVDTDPIPVTQPERTPTGAIGVLERPRREEDVVILGYD